MRKELWRFELFVEAVRVSINFQCNLEVVWKAGKSKAATKTEARLDNDLHQAKLRENLILNSKVKKEGLNYLAKPSELVVILLTSKGKKQAGKVFLNLCDQIAKSGQRQVVPIEKCPDSSANLTFSIKAFFLQDVPPKSIPVESTKRATENHEMTGNPLFKGPLGIQKNGSNEHKRHSFDFNIESILESAFQSAPHIQNRKTQRNKEIQPKSGFLNQETQHKFVSSLCIGKSSLGQFEKRSNERKCDEANQTILGSQSAFVDETLHREHFNFEFKRNKDQNYPSSLTSSFCESPRAKSSKKTKNFILETSKEGETAHLEVRSYPKEPPFKVPGEKSLFDFASKSSLKNQRELLEAQDDSITTPGFLNSKGANGFQFEYNRGNNQRQVSQREENGRLRQKLKDLGEFYDEEVKKNEKLLEENERVSRAVEEFRRRERELKKEEEEREKWFLEEMELFESKMTKIKEEQWKLRSSIVEKEKKYNETIQNIQSIQKEREFGLLSEVNRLMDEVVKLENNKKQQNGQRETEERMKKLEESLIRKEKENEKLRMEMEEIKIKQKTKDKLGQRGNERDFGEKEKGEDSESLEMSQASENIMEIPFDLMKDEEEKQKKQLEELLNQEREKTKRLMMEIKEREKEKEKMKKEQVKMEKELEKREEMMLIPNGNDEETQNELKEERDSLRNELVNEKTKTMSLLSQLGEAQNISIKQEETMNKAKERIRELELENKVTRERLEKTKEENKRREEELEATKENQKETVETLEREKEKFNRLERKLQEENERKKQIQTINERLEKSLEETKKKKEEIEQKLIRLQEKVKKREEGLEEIEHKMRDWVESEKERLGKKEKELLEKEETIQKNQELESKVIQSIQSPHNRAINQPHVSFMKFSQVL